MQQGRIIFLLVLAVIFLLLDWYVFQAVRTVWHDSPPATRQRIYALYWSITVLSLMSVASYVFLGSQWATWKTLSMGGTFIVFLSKLLVGIALVIEDLSRLLRWGTQVVVSAGANTEGISRSEFLSQAALVTAALPLTAMSFGILSGAHDYRVRRRQIYLPNLPKKFDGIRLLQISDIHSGSFFNKRAVRGGIEMILREKPDIICFTGDLVNNETKEVNDYIQLFEKLKAPLGVYSTLGNHDYGDYHPWASMEEKRRNFEDMLKAHRLLGWRLLLDEHLPIEVEGEAIALLGVQNWGTGRFPKYGKLHKAYQGTEDYPVKILLSHDPSHWDAQIRPEFPDIDLTLAGHTHGMQFGIEIGDFRWSPAKYRYKQWADLYREGQQYLYVNRGFGYIGFPGRVGILPEITVLELRSTKA
ncbi:hypothetical protein FHS56_001474 [Thermonema lapsum]|uniref:Calcineurin-like phosphoesterase domain-containing protein n=1 Tax=Thermonema lapsum TaxID=28195 RepID=A0A846MRA3_9BACT|nr:metallophosphoesterase [Thermonema lapsum]NIK73961.1 hypothetical protein [Thermonema lapsum]